MRPTFPELKIGSTFYRNGTLLEVVEMPCGGEGSFRLRDLIQDEIVDLSLRAMRDQYRAKPGQMEMVPRDIARAEARLAKRRLVKATGYRGRKLMDLRGGGLHEWLLECCQMRKQMRYQINYTIRENFTVTTYRRTPRVDFSWRRETGNIRTPWDAGTLPVGVTRYLPNDPYLVLRPWLKLHVDPRKVRNVDLSIEYVKQIVEATLKEIG